MRKHKPAIPRRPAAVALSVGALVALLAAAPLAADRTTSTVRLADFSYERIVSGLLLLLPPAGGGNPSGRQPVEPDAMLTADQTALLVPAITAMRASPFPSPSTARQILRTIDSVLTQQQRNILAKAAKAGPIANGLRDSSRIGARSAGGASTALIPTRGQRAELPPGTADGAGNSASSGSQGASGQTGTPRRIGASLAGSVEESRLAMVNFLYRRLTALEKDGPGMQGTDATK